MFPIDPYADRPAVPYSERIFAASKELHDAYGRGEEWTRAMPLHEASTLFFLEVLSDAIGDLNERWNAAGRPGPFPDSLDVQAELRRIICLEDGASQKAPGADPSPTMPPNPLKAQP